MDNSTCIPESLVCDGSVQCPDMSDEKESICSKCPRGFGHPVYKNFLATLPCKNKFTKHWICSVPCNGIPDGCEGDADEDCNKNNVLYVFLIALSIFGLAVGWGLLIWMLGSKENEKNVSKNMEMNDMSKSTHGFQLATLILKLTQENISNWERLKHAVEASFIHKEMHDQSESLDNELKHLLIYCEQQSITEEDFLNCAKRLYHFECHFHLGNEEEANICLLTQLGCTKYYMDIYEAANPGIFATFLKKFTLKLKLYLCQSGRKLIYLKNIFKFTLRTLLYIVDLVKDCFLIFVLFPFVNISMKNFPTFSNQLLFILCLSVVLGSALNILPLIKNKDLKLRKSQKFLMAILFPLIPLVCNFHILSLTLKSELHKKRKHDTNLDGKNQFSKVKEFRENMLKWKLFLANCKVLENTVESFTQVIILLVISLIKITETKTFEGLQELITNDNDFLLIASAIWSLQSLVRGSVLSENLIHDEILSLTAQLILGLSYLLAYVTRIIAITLVFTPSLGLFNVLNHWKFGKIKAMPNAVFDTIHHQNGTIEVVTLKEAWKTVKNPETLNILSLGDCYISILIGLVFHILLTVLVKSKFHRKFTRLTNFPSKIVHLISQSTKPSIYLELNDLMLKTGQEVTKSLISMKKEYSLMTLLFIMEHLLMCVPIWILHFQIYERTQYLEKYFPPLEKEIASYNVVAWLTVIMPVFFIISGYLQMFLFKFFYQSAHPWSQQALKIYKI